MSGPEWRVLESEPRNFHILTMRHIEQARTLLILVCALRIPRTAKPKRPPVAKSVSIHHTFSRNGDAVNLIHIEQCREILATLSFNARIADREILDVVAAFQFSTFCHPKVHALAHEKGTTEESALRNNHHSFLS